MKKNTAKQQRKQHFAIWLKEYQWKPGQSGNPKGRRPGKTLKEWAKEFLMSLPDDKKLEFLKEMNPDIVWKMAEGNPPDDITINATIREKPISDDQIRKIAREVVDGN